MASRIKFFDFVDCINVNFLKLLWTFLIQFTSVFCLVIVVSDCKMTQQHVPIMIQWLNKLTTNFSRIFEKKNVVFICFSSIFWPSHMVIDLINIYKTISISSTYLYQTIICILFALKSFCSFIQCKFSKVGLFLLQYYVVFFFLKSS